MMMMMMMMMLLFQMGANDRYDLVSSSVVDSSFHRVYMGMICMICMMKYEKGKKKRKRPKDNTRRKGNMRETKKGEIEKKKEKKKNKKRHNVG
jgi:hypothetical protein